MRTATGYRPRVAPVGRATGRAAPPARDHQPPPGPVPLPGAPWSRARPRPAGSAAGTPGIVLATSGQIRPRPRPDPCRRAGRRAQVALHGGAARECCPQPLAFRLPVNTRCPGRSVRPAYSTGRPSEQDRMLGRKSQDPTSSAAHQLGAAYHLMLKYRAVSHGSYRHLCASRPSASKSAAVAVCGLSDRPDASGRATRARRTIDHHMNLPLGGPSPAPLAGPTAARAPRAALFSRPSSSVTLLAMGHSSTSVAEGI